MNKIKTVAPSVIGFVAFIFLTVRTDVSSAQTIPVLDWVRVTATSSGSPDYEKGKGYAITVDASGDVYATGRFYGTVDFNPGAGVFNLTAAGTYDVFVSKIDVNGNFVWARAMGGTADEDGFSIAVDVFGNVFTTGYFNGTADFDPGAGTYNLTSAGYEDIFISKLDVNGNFLWAKSIGSNDLGVGISDEGYSIAVDGTGNVYATGVFHGTVDFDPGPGVVNLSIPSGSCPSCAQMFVAKFDTNGNLVWAKGYGTYGDSEPSAIAVGPTGNIYLTGYFWSSVGFGSGVFVSANGTKDIFIAKLNNNGVGIWAKSMGDSDDSSYYPERGYSITVDGAGNVFTTGRYELTTDFDPGPGVFNLTSVGDFDVFILKLNDNGDFVWAKSMGDVNGSGVIDDYGFAIVTDASGNVYTAGQYRGTVDFDPGPGVYTLTDKGLGDVFISKLDNNGNFMWAGSMSGCCGRDIGFSMAIDPSGGIYTAGDWSGGGPTNPGDFDPNPCTFDVIGSSGMFVQKLKLGTLPPPPTLTSFAPLSGFVGTSVTLTGTNFGALPSDNAASFFNNRTATTTASTPTSITTTVPAGAATGKISVTVHCVTVQSVDDFIVLTAATPTISGFTPTSGPVGTSVTITGTNFSATAASNSVKFNGTTATVTSSTATSISTKVPPGATTGKITVTVAGNTATSAVNFTVTALPPTITSFTPTSGPVGTTVIITGTNFSATPTSNTVKFNGTTAIVSASTATSITATVPVNATTGTIKVTVAAITATSASSFTITTSPPPVVDLPPVITAKNLTTVIGGIVTLDLLPLIEKTDDELDISSIAIAEQPASGASAFIDQGLLTIDDTGISFAGTDRLQIVACDFGEDCATQEFTIDVSGDITVYNALSPNGANPALIIQNIEVLPATLSNRVVIFDRWQNEVWRGTNYDNATVVFKGVGSGGADLPTGTYFYKIEFDGGKKELTGFISLKR